MIKEEDKLVMRAVALCFKPYLKQEEAMIYCNLGRTQFATKSREAGVCKNKNGYYSSEDLDKMCVGGEDHESRIRRLLALKRKIENNKLK